MHQDESQDTAASPRTNGASPPALGVGAKVYVRDRYMGKWSGGFEVAEICTDGYRIRRISDKQMFPDVFPLSDVRVERRKQPLRGIEGSYLDRRHESR